MPFRFVSANRRADRRQIAYPMRKMFLVQCVKWGVKWGAERSSWSRFLFCWNAGEGINLVKRQWTTSLSTRGRCRVQNSWEVGKHVWFGVDIASFLAMLKWKSPGNLRPRSWIGESPCHYNYSSSTPFPQSVVFFRCSKHRHRTLWRLGFSSQRLLVPSWGRMRSFRRGCQGWAKRC